LVPPDAHCEEPWEKLDNGSPATSRRKTAMVYVSNPNVSARGQRHQISRKSGSTFEATGRAARCATLICSDSGGRARESW